MRENKGNLPILGLYIEALREAQAVPPAFKILVTGLERIADGASLAQVCGFEEEDGAWRLTV